MNRQLCACLTTALLVCAGPRLLAKSNKDSKPMQTKILVVYFSHSSNTRELAKQVQELTGGDLFEIVPEKQYPAEYDDVVKQAKEELKSDFKPKLQTKLKNLAAYDMVFIGSPNWWGTVAGPVRTFLADYDLEGKSVAPFITHEGSGMGSSARDISKRCPGATILDGLAVRGSSVKSARSDVSQWLRKLNLLK